MSSSWHNEAWISKRNMLAYINMESKKMIAHKMVNLESNTTTGMQEK
jgi:hypothetical protein